VLAPVAMLALVPGLNAKGGLPPRIGSAPFMIRSSMKSTEVVLIQKAVAQVCGVAWGRDAGL
jgi:hypothetical protein